MGRAHRREHLTDALVRELEKPQAGYYLVYDDDAKRMAIAVFASDAKVWKFIYRFKKKTKWKTIGSFEDWNTKKARAEAYRLGGLIADKIDPQAEHMEEKRAESFLMLTNRYYGEYAEDNLKSFYQGRYLLNKYVPKWFNEMRSSEITRVDVMKVILPLRNMTPVSARQTLAAISSVMTWAVEEAGLLSSNPCTKIKRPKKGEERERVLSPTEVPRFWAAFADYGVTGVALKVLLLTGQRPGEVAHMRREHIADGWWRMPGAPCRDPSWPGTKNGRDHSVWLPAAVVDLIPGGMFSPIEPDRLKRYMQDAMREISAKLGVPLARPHDLRRTHGTTITRLLGFGGRAAMNHIQNHKERGVGSIYDRHGYYDETKKVMERVAAELLRLANGGPAEDNVVEIKKGGP